MTVRLRAPHLLCLLTFSGVGYSPEFVANFERIVERVGRESGAGEEIEVVDGPDDVCMPLLGSSGCHCMEPGPASRDRTAAEQVEDLLGLRIVPATRLRLSLERVGAMRAAFQQGIIRAACAGCPWKSMCDQVAEAWR